METIDYILFAFACTVCFYIGIRTGIVVESDILKTDYCEYNNATYEQIDEVDYCIKDNQLFQIEWVK